MAPIRTTAASRAVLAIAAIVFVLGLVRLAAHAGLALSFPYGFDYGEGVVWQQMRDMLAGQAYRPIGVYPAIAYEYPPLYHLAAAATGWATGIDALYAGRLLSLVCTGVCALLVGVLTARMVGGEPRGIRLGAAAIAGLAFATMPLLDSWALLMRVDLLACVFTLAGMFLACHAPRSLAATVAAGLAFTAALYTRQTCFPAPAAAFVVLLLASPRRAWTMAAVSIASGLIVLAAVESATRGGFLLNIVSYNVNRILWDHAGALAATLLANIVLLALAAIGAAAAFPTIGMRRWRDLRTAEPAQLALAIVLATLALKTLMLPAILKSGASDNYLIDWFTQICMLAGFAAIPLLRAASGLAAAPSLLLYALFALGLPLQVWGAQSLPDRAAADAQRRELDTIVARIRQSDRPVISDDATLLLRAGKPLQWEPAIVAELASFGRYDEQRFAAMVRRGAFGFFVTDGDRGDILFDQRFNPLVADAIHAAYPRHVHLGGRTLHFPAAPQRPDRLR
ncbi:hypothetical protein AB2M62_13275 [Sphingomonas sp. MMS12-HWE2-04]|uniref:hypothetical protein n=1 Tax=Sphingomonas sp. MMS12-HWE2-04 TaxID=3234199 RepID=UPI00384B9593